VKRGGDCEQAAGRPDALCEMKESLVDRIPFAKIVVVLAIAFGVGLGLCGLSFVVAANGFKSHEEFGVDSLGIANISLVVMVLSGAALLPALVAWAVAGIFGLGREAASRRHCWAMRMTKTRNKNGS